jgi:hypothetical protein
LEEQQQADVRGMPRAEGCGVMVVILGASAQAGPKSGAAAPGMPRHIAGLERARAPIG